MPPSRKLEFRLLTHVVYWGSGLFLEFDETFNLLILPLNSTSIRSFNLFRSIEIKEKTAPITMAIIEIMGTVHNSLTSPLTLIEVITRIGAAAQMTN
jgi:hypothetical protein